MRKLLWISLTAGMLLTAACDHNATGDGDGADTTACDTATALVVAPPDSARSITGVAIDGSRRNVYLKVGDDTLDFELPPSDISWEIGDTLRVVVVSTAHGDSVTSVINDEA